MRLTNKKFNGRISLPTNVPVSIYSLTFLTITFTEWHVGAISNRAHILWGN